MKNNLSNIIDQIELHPKSMPETMASKVEVDLNKTIKIREFINEKIQSVLLTDTHKIQLVPRYKKDKIETGVLLDTSLEEDKEGIVNIDHHKEKATTPAHTATMMVLDIIKNYTGEGIKASRKMYTGILIELNKHKIPYQVQVELMAELAKDKTDYHFINSKFKEFNCNKDLNLYGDHLDTDMVLAMIAFRNPQFALKHEFLFQKVSQYADFSLDDKTVVLDKFTAKEVSEMINELTNYLETEISADIRYRKKIPAEKNLNSDYVNHLVINGLLSVLPKFIANPTDFLKHINLIERVNNKKNNQAKNLSRQIENKEIKINELADKKKNSFVFIANDNGNNVNVFVLNEYLRENYPNSKLTVTEKKIYNGTKKTITIAINPKSEADLQNFNLEADLINILKKREQEQKDNIIKQLNKKIAYIENQIKNNPDTIELLEDLKYYQKELNMVETSNYNWSGRNGLISTISYLNSKELERIILPYLKSKTN